MSKTDPTAIDLIHSVFDTKNDPARSMREQVWKRNILFYIGEQWIFWSKSRNTFIRKTVAGNAPTPVDNIIRDYVRAKKALTLNKKYTVKIWPNSDELADKDAASLGEKLLRHMDARNDGEFLDEVEKTALWAYLCGVGFQRTYPDDDAGGWFVDANGDLVKTGDVVSDNLLPFSVLEDPIGDRLRRKRWLGIKSLRSVEWVQDVFGVKVTPNVEEDVISQEKQLAKLVADVSPWKGLGMDSNHFSNYHNEDLCVLKEIEFRPCKKYPHGRYIIGAGDKVIKDYDRMPIPLTPDGEWNYTVTDFHDNYVPGCFWSDPLVNDLIPHQMTINQIDQATEMNRKSIGRPVITKPIDSSVKLLTAHGQSFYVIEFDNLLPGGEPKIHHGQPLPEQVRFEREVHRSAAQDVSGDPKNILRGNAPAQASGVLVDILRESAEQSHAPDIDRFYRGLQRVYRKRLIVAQEVYQEDRLIKVAGRGKGVEVFNFRGANLRNNTDIRLELDSRMSTTFAGQATMFAEMAKSGVFGGLVQMPSVQRQLMNRFGLTGFDDDQSPDIERAGRENSRIAQASDTEVVVESSPEGDFFYIEGIQATAGNPLQNPEAGVVYNDPAFKFDNHIVHMDEHRKFILSDEFQELTDIQKAVLVNHADAHQFAIMAQQQMSQPVEEGAPTGEEMP